MSALISLTLYDEKDEPIKTYEKSIIRWGFLKKAIKLSKGMDENNFSETDVDKINEFVCELFGNQFTAKELEDESSFDEVFAVFKVIMNKASALTPNKVPNK